MTIKQESEPFRVMHLLNRLQVYSIKITGNSYLQVLPAHDFLWGYKDNIIDKLKTFKTFPFVDFGMLVTVMIRLQIFYHKHSYLCINASL